MKFYTQKEEQRKRGVTGATRLQNETNFHVNVMEDADFDADFEPPEVEGQDTDSNIDDPGPPSSAHSNADQAHTAQSAQVQVGQEQEVDQDQNPASAGGKTSFV